MKPNLLIVEVSKDGKSRELVIPLYPSNDSAISQSNAFDAICALSARNYSCKVIRNVISKFNNGQYCYPDIETEFGNYHIDNVISYYEFKEAQDGDNNN